jgi:hypothetical protein
MATQAEHAVKNFFIFALALKKKIFFAQAQNALTQNFAGKNFEISTKTK